MPLSDLRSQLQSTLGGSYSIERELGGGACRASSWRVHLDPARMSDPLEGAHP